jgi:hypothetical protein
MKLWTSVLILALSLPLFASENNFGAETTIWFDAQATNFTGSALLGNLDKAAKTSYTALRNSRRYASNTVIEPNLDSTTSNGPQLAMPSLQMQLSE